MKQKRVSHRHFLSMLDRGVLLTRNAKWGKPRVKVKLQIRCDRVRIRDHRAPNGYRCYNHYYYQ